MKFSLFPLRTAGLVSVFLAGIILLGACKTVQPQKRITVDLRSPKVTVGTAGAQFDKFMSFGGLRKGNIDVSYYPIDDVVCLLFRVDYISVYQYWSEENREAFIKALEQYKQDYNPEMIRNNRKTRKLYGSVLGFTIWETSQFSRQGRGYPTVDFGYQFRDGAPYFTTTQREAVDENPNQGGGSETRSSGIVIVYFTRAQADALAVLFNQENLRNLGSGVSSNKESAADVDVDAF